MHPIEVGKNYLFETATLYWAGTVTAVHPFWVELDDCHWVHWTGRKSTLFQGGLDPTKFGSDRRPRTEYIGKWFVSIGAIMAYGPLPGSIPNTSLEE